MKTTPIPLRMPAPLLAKARSVAKEIGVPVSTLIRFAILSMLPEVESGEIVAIPQPPRRGRSAVDAFSAPKALLKLAKEKASAAGITFSELMRRALRTELDRSSR